MSQVSQWIAARDSRRVDAAAPAVAGIQFLRRRIDAAHFCQWEDLLPRDSGTRYCPLLRVLSKVLRMAATKAGRRSHCVRRRCWRSQRDLGAGPTACLRAGSPPLHNGGQRRGNCRHRQREWRRNRSAYRRRCPRDHREIPRSSGKRDWSLPATWLKRGCVEDSASPRGSIPNRYSRRASCRPRLPFPQCDSASSFPAWLQGD